MSIEYAVGCLMAMALVAYTIGYLVGLECPYPSDRLPNDAPDWAFGLAKVLRKGSITPATEFPSAITYQGIRVAWITDQFIINGVPTIKMSDPLYRWMTAMFTRRQQWRDSLSAACRTILDDSNTQNTRRHLETL